MPQDKTVAIIGAGPIGLEMAAALTIAGIPYLLIEKGQIGQTIFDFPPETRFFSSSERIGIAGIPIHTVDQQKCSREAYLAYLRMVAGHYELAVNSYEEVVQLQKTEGGFLIKSKSMAGEKNYRARFLILSTGGLSRPRQLGVPGEELPHVFFKMSDPHLYFQRKVAIIGGKNSAVEAALRSFHAGAYVTIIVRGSAFSPQEIKYWLLPELEGRIKKGQVHIHFNSPVAKILPGEVILEKGDAIACDFVIKAIGFLADMSLFVQLGADLTPETSAPGFDPRTMETSVKNVFVLGTAAGGTQGSFQLYIENTHQHVGKILASICRELKIEEPAVEWIKKGFRKVANLEE